MTTERLFPESSALAANLAARKVASVIDAKQQPCLDGLAITRQGLDRIEHLGPPFLGIVTVCGLKLHWVI